jgi:hypothetical protein
MNERLTLEQALKRHLREAQAILETMSADTDEARFRDALLGLALQFAEDVAGEAIDLSLVEILTDTLQSLLDTGDSGIRAPQWVASA